jgi:hypothetical protein
MFSYLYNCSYSLVIIFPLVFNYMLYDIIVHSSSTKGMLRKQSTGLVRLSFQLKQNTILSLART